MHIGVPREDVYRPTAWMKSTWTRCSGGIFPRTYQQLDGGHVREAREGGGKAMEKKKPHFHPLVFSQSGRTRLLIPLSTVAVFGTGLWFVLSPQSALAPSPLKVAAGGDTSPAGGGVAGWGARGGAE